MPQFEAYALRQSGRRAIALRSMVNITGEGGAERTAWVHVAPFGRWEGHSEGAFSLTREHFEACVADAEKRVTPQSLDYEHASIRPTGEPTPAAGYVQRLEIRDDGLYALCEFTRRAAGHIKEGEYRFCSGVFLFNEPDRVTGEPVACVLDTIALTNRPFLDGQHPITLTRSTRKLTLSNGVAKMEIQREAIDKALDELGSEALTPEQVIAIVEGLSKLAEATKPDASDKPSEEKPAEEGASEDKPAEEAAAAAAPTADLTVALAGEVGAADAGTFISRLMELTGLDEAGLMAALEANLEAVVAMLKGEPEAMPAAALTVRALSESLAQVRNRLHRYEQAERKAAEAKVEGEVDALVRAGKIHPAKRTEIRALAVKAPAQFRALAAALVPVFPVGEHASAITPPGSESQSLPETVVNEKDPRVIALSKELDRAGVTDKAIRSRHILKAIKG